MPYGCSSRFVRTHARSMRATNTIAVLMYFVLLVLVWKLEKVVHQHSLGFCCHLNQYEYVCLEFVTHAESFECICVAKKEMVAIEADQSAKHPIWVFLFFFLTKLCVIDDAGIAHFDSL